MGVRRLQLLLVMPSPEITWTPLHTYIDREPSFRELAEEQWGIARHRYFADDSWRDRLEYATSAWRLQRAAPNSLACSSGVSRGLVRSTLMR